MAFELIEKYKPTIWNCQVCSVCQRGPWNPYPPKGPTSDRLCPEYEKFRTLTHSALGRIQAAKWMLEGKYQPDDEFVKVTYDCLLCGACSTVGCVVDKEHVPLFRDLRTDLVNSGLDPIKPFQKAAENIQKEGNRFGRPKSERAKWAEGIQTAKSSDLLFFAGCVASYRAPETAQATAGLLNHLEIEFTILGEDEMCCGNPLISSGQMATFEEVVRQNANSIRNAGAKRVVTSCACGYNVLKFDYPRILGEQPFEVVHITELLAGLLGQGILRPDHAIKETVAYQDPCHLVRMGGKVIKEPRMLLQSIPELELVEMEGSGKDTQCCGHFPAELPELSLFTGINRLKDARAAGAGTIVTACSFCEWNLKRARKSENMEINVIDIVELIARSLGL